MTRGRPLLIVGAGGFGREAAELIRTVNQAGDTWDLLGFLDDAPGLWGTRVDDLPVLGPAVAVNRFPEAQLIVSVGHPGNYVSRKRIVQRLGLPASRYATLIHPQAMVPGATLLGPGTVLLAGVVVTTGVKIGSHVVVMPGTVLTHDDVVEDYATLGAGVRLAGRVRIGEGVYVGAGVLVREDLSVGAWSLIGMGAIVLTDVPAGEVWVGTPARHLRPVTDQDGIGAARP
jgi:sugar O-acyltransferase (sialic acid O-acetyltransferase NeuD family)